MKPMVENTDDFPPLPEWCGVYEGLSAEEIERLDAATKQRLDLTVQIDLGCEGERT